MYKRNNWQSQARFWAIFRLLNTKILKLYKEISGLNHFLSKYLTINFAVYVGETVYFLYGFLFVQTGALLDLALLVTFLLEFNFMLNAFTFTCSQIVATNGHIHKNMGRISIKLLAKSSTRVGNQHDYQSSANEFHQVGLSELLKLDQMAGNSRFVGKVCFKLLDNYRINSKMFLMVKNLFFNCVLILILNVLDFLLY